MHRPDVRDWKKAAMLALVLLLLGRFLVLGWIGLLANVNSNGGDQGAYLELGLAIRAGEALTDGNRHPLLPLLIAPFASREWSYFTVAKLIVLTSSGLALAVTYWVGRRLHDGWTALLATVLLAVNQEFLSHAYQVLCESLLVLIFVAAWYTSVRALGRLSSAKTGFVAGVLAGLAYMTKGTGVFLVLCFAGSAFALYRHRAVKAHGLWAFLLGYLLVASPLLIYNGIQYHNPFYNFSTTHAMWLDNWGDRYESGQDFATVLTYLRSHSLAEVVARQSRGMVALLPVMATALLVGPNEQVAYWLRTGWVWFAMGCELLLLYSMRWSAAIAAYVAERLPRLLMTGSLFALFYLLFAWYAPVSDSPRFFLPLAPIFYLSVAEPLMSWARRAWERSGSLSRHKGAVGLLVGVCLSGWAIAGSVQAFQWVIDPFAHDRLANGDPDQVVEWINGHVQDDLKILWGPSHMLPKWRFLPSVTHQAIPSDLNTWEELEHHMSQHDFRYLVLDPKMYDLRDHVLGQYLHSDGARILFREVPPRWRFVFAKEGGATSPKWIGINWYILEMVSADAVLFDPMTPARVGSSVDLIGYRMDQSDLRPGEPLDLTLAWSAVAPLEADYSVFIHMLGPDGRMWCQGDRFPLGGMFPTSQWREGMQIIDRYRCEVDPGTPPGEYAIMVGMYDLATAARLPATTAQGRPLANDQIPIPKTVRVELEHSFAVPVRTQHAQMARLGSSIDLLGYDLPRTLVKAGEALPLTVYGRATTEWLPGEAVVGSDNLPVEAETKGESIAWSPECTMPPLASGCPSSTQLAGGSSSIEYFSTP